MVRRVLVDVANDLIAGFEGVTVCNHTDRFGGVGHHRNIFGTGFHQLPEVFVKTIGNMFVANVLKQHSAADLTLPVGEVDRAVGSGRVQWRHAAISQEVDVLLVRKVAQVDV